MISRRHAPIRAALLAATLLVPLADQPAHADGSSGTGLELSPILTLDHLLTDTGGFSEDPQLLYKHPIFAEYTLWNLSSSTVTGWVDATIANQDYRPNGGAPLPPASSAGKFWVYDLAPGESTRVVVALFSDPGKATITARFHQTSPATLAVPEDTSDAYVGDRFEYRPEMVHPVYIASPFHDSVKAYAFADVDPVFKVTSTVTPNPWLQQGEAPPPGHKGDTVTTTYTVVDPGEFIGYAFQGLGSMADNAFAYPSIPVPILYKPERRRPVSFGTFVANDGAGALQNRDVEQVLRGFTQLTKFSFVGSSVLSAVIGVGSVIFSAIGDLAGRRDDSIDIVDYLTTTYLWDYLTANCDSYVIVDSRGYYASDFQSMINGGETRRALSAIGEGDMPNGCASHYPHDYRYELTASMNRLAPDYAYVKPFVAQVPHGRQKQVFTLTDLTIAGGAVDVASLAPGQITWSVEDAYGRPWILAKPIDQSRALELYVPAAWNADTACVESLQTPCAFRVSATVHSGGKDYVGVAMAAPTAKAWNPAAATLVKTSGSSLVLGLPHDDARQVSPGDRIPLPTPAGTMHASVTSVTLGSAGGTDQISLKLDADSTTTTAFNQLFASGTTQVPANELANGLMWAHPSTVQAALGDGQCQPGEPLAHPDCSLTGGVRAALAIPGVIIKQKQSLTPPGGVLTNRAVVVTNLAGRDVPYIQSGQMITPGGASIAYTLRDGEITFGDGDLTGVFSPDGKLALVRATGQADMVTAVPFLGWLGSGNGVCEADEYPTGSDCTATGGAPGVCGDGVCDLSVDFAVLPAQPG
jgi:hypothetical protein